ncbi:MAG: DUF262 domain-containing protein [Aureliella sp.]
MASEESEISEIEESEEILDFQETQPIEFWEKKQRELVTNSVDYNLETIAQLIENDTIDLKPKYQRRFRWDEKRQSKLIESFLMNVPVPPIFLNEDSYGKYSVIDGKQRLTAISQFMRGRLVLRDLEVFSDINGKSLDDLPGVFKSVIKTRPTIRAIIVLRQSDADIKFEVFQRLNTGGVKLNPQEIRNSTYPGPMNDLILELSELPQFHELLGIKNKSKSKIHQEMRDAEFVLRYFTFRENWSTFQGGVKRHLDLFMSENQKVKAKELDTLKKEFLETLQSVKACFGEHAFHRWQPEQNHWRKQVLASLFDAQMLACKGVDETALKVKKELIDADFKALFRDEEFRKSIDSATNTPSYFKYRIKTLKSLLQRHTENL